jgi:uncharacterized protein
MADQLIHFAINAENTERGCRFYEQVFGWKFEAWGPPGFFKIDTQGGPVQVIGALQQRREIEPGVRMPGYECTISVGNVDKTAAAIEAGGGRIVMPAATIPGVGRLIFFEDTEKNIAGAIEFEKT